MEFLKKYWLIILLIIAAVVVYFWYMKKQTPTPKTETKGCTDVTAAEYNAKVQQTIAAIDASQDWLDYVTGNVQSGETLAQAKQRNAEYYVQTALKICKPATA